MVRSSWHISSELLQVLQTMETRPLVIVTTRLPPQICGVGTFSWLLDGYWPGDRSQHQFLVVDGADDSRAALHHHGISAFGKDWSALANALRSADSADVLLHYAGRAYHRLGCPVGLPAVLRTWKQQHPRSRLLIFFHEVPGRLPLTSRHYLSNLCNFWVVRRLAAVGDVIVTNTAEHVRTLQRLSNRRDIHCLPVGSNVEKANPARRDRAATEFVVFGLPYGRWQTLKAFDSEIQRWQDNGRLTKLHLIGPRDNKFDVRAEALVQRYQKQQVVLRHGNIPADQISALLSEVRFGLTSANDLTWSKSTTLMAFMAHGCVVVGTSKSSFEPLSWVVTPQELDSVSDSELLSRAEAMHRWYEMHADWKLLARTVSDLLQNLSGNGI